MGRLPVMQQLVEQGYLLGVSVAEQVDASPHNPANFHSSCLHDAWLSISYKACTAVIDKLEKETGEYELGVHSLWGDAFRVGVEEVLCQRKAVESKPPTWYSDRRPPSSSSPPPTIEI